MVRLSGGERHGGGEIREASNNCRLGLMSSASLYKNDH